MHNYIYKCFDFSGDGADLLDVFKDQDHVFLLDSSLSDSVRGRYSFLGFNPFHVAAFSGTNVIEDLRKEFLPFQIQNKKEHTPFDGGIAGVLSYDYGVKLQNIKSIKQNEEKFPDSFFGFYDAVLTVDHYKDKLYIYSTGLPEKNGSLRLKKAIETLNSIEKSLASYFKEPGKKRANLNIDLTKKYDSFKSNFSKEEYLDAVNQALDYIRAGEIYQVNLSQRFTFNKKAPDYDSYELYHILRNLAPSHFSSFFDTGDFKIISSSPERFLSLDQHKIQTIPMKGTRPRSSNPQKDLFYKNELLHSRKDKAELLMVTDLLRNDLGRVCRYGSIEVKDLRNIEQYKYVYQATSTVEGQLAEELDGFDVLKSCFPGGSITGCPKIRSMQVIEELEPNSRGFYTGAMGYVSFRGDMDFNILIRSIIETKDKYLFHVGGGIVADSNPLDEYNETLTKAQAIAQSLGVLNSLKQKSINTT